VIKIERILFPTDFSECAEHAQQYATELAKRFETKLYLMHVLDTRIYGHLEPFANTVWSIYDAKEQAAKSITEIVPEKERKALQVESLVREGTPFVEIIKFAKEAEIDLIVLGTHGRTGLTHMLIGSVAEKVVRKAPCPVLTIRPDNVDFVMP